MKVFIVLALVAVTLASEPPRYGPPPKAYHPAPKYEEPTEPPQYAYEYGVEAGDDYHKAAFSHNEDRDYDKTVGSYKVDLPDGRTQIVTYEDTGYGFVADVRYEGVAQYPPEQEYKPAYHAEPKAYKPAPPAYPAPSYPPPAYARK